EPISITASRYVSGLGTAATSAIDAKMTAQAWAMRAMPFHSIGSRNWASSSAATSFRAAVRWETIAGVDMGCCPHARDRIETGLAKVSSAALVHSCIPWVIAKLVKLSWKLHNWGDARCL